MDRVRREVSANLALAAATRGGPLRVIQESSAAVYPSRGCSWVDESVPARPGSHIRSVLEAERNVLGLNALGLSAVCLRFGFFYGPSDGPTQQLLDSIRRGWSPLFGAADGYCSWTSHDDAASAVIAAFAVAGGVYNVVDDDPLQKRLLADGLAKAMGARSPKFLPSWTSNLVGAVGETLARSLRVSNRKFKESSGWSPKYPDALVGMEFILRGGA
jgi:nucleoside-diphosphate-sugar epimerase